jgi:predicted DCC family thiol-disulfide oxidoreductase YuxK
LARALTDLVLYDGTCALCHGWVRFLLTRDRDGTLFTFAPQQEEESPSIRVRTADGRLLERSAAVLHLLERVGGLWRVLARAGRLVPRPLRDRVYDFVARVRYRIFGRTTTACPVVPPELRARFRR